MRTIVALVLAGGVSSTAAGVLQECLEQGCGSGEAANLACEADLMRQRAGALEALDFTTNRL